ADARLRLPRPHRRWPRPAGRHRCGEHPRGLAGAPQPRDLPHRAGRGPGERAPRRTPARRRRGTRGGNACARHPPHGGRARPPAAGGKAAGRPARAIAPPPAHARPRGGVPLADARGASPAVFVPLFCDVVRAGELSGALPAVLLRLADHAEASAATRARLRAALTYPVVMVLATLAVLAFLLAWVVPQVTHLFAESGAQLPLATRVLVSITHL